MVIFPGIKINLGLKVLGKRPDGFHDLQSVFLPLPIGDVLEAVPARGFSLVIHGIAVDGDIEGNIVARAFRLMEKRYGIEALEFHLLKTIPPGTGVGAGSADGAFALKLIDQIYSLNLSEPELEALALQLGSDCPFFISNRSAFVCGRGERLEQIPLKLQGWWVALIFTGIHVSTRDAFKGIKPDANGTSPKDIVLNSAPEHWSASLVNDFEASVFSQHPSIKRAKDFLLGQGAAYASMTGTGSTVYGFFSAEPMLRSLPKNWWVKIVRL